MKLSGYKTYLAAFLGIVLTGAHASGYITDSQYETIGGFIAAGGLAALRNALPAAK